MFTGIVTHQGRIVDVRADADAGALRRLVIEVTSGIAGAAIGGSVAIQGVCLTITQIESAPEAQGPAPAAHYHFDAVPETLRRTTLGLLRAGDPVNLEAALRMGDELGGHLVQGHVDGTGTLVEVAREAPDGGDDAHGGEVRLTVEVPEAWTADLLPKGSITINGVSLTVGDVWAGPEGTCRFDVFLIPHTLAVTTLGLARVGDAVNLERDMFGRWVARHVERYLAEAPEKQG